jgi:hypothetical protein
MDYKRKTKAFLGRYIVPGRNSDVIHKSVAGYEMRHIIDWNIRYAATISVFVDLTAPVNNSNTPAGRQTYQSLNESWQQVGETRI